MSVDPLNIKHISELIDAKSWKKYEHYWKNFCSALKISQEKPPTPDLVLEFLKICRYEKEYAPTTLWTVYSCLNKFCRHLYDMQLNNNVAISDFLRVSGKDFEVAKAWVMDEEQTCDFMTRAPNENRYWLVRKVFVVINLYGGLRGAEMRALKRSDVKSVLKGYEIEYIVSKNLDKKNTVKKNKFLVPYNDSGVGYCGASIMKLYFDTLNEDFKENVTEGVLFYTGTGKNNEINSKFEKKPMGKTTLSDTGKEVARFLELPNHLKYTGHCFRRMSATFSANNGASALELQQKHNWKNPGMALEYINNSRPHREKMAAKIQNVEKRKPSATITSADLNESPGTSTIQSEIEEPDTKRKKTVSTENTEKSVLSEAKSDLSKADTLESTNLTTMFDKQKFSNCTVNINIQK